MDKLLRKLSETLYLSEDSITLQPIFGGDINNSYKLSSGSDNFFLKHSRHPKLEDMFYKEEIGLNELRKGPFAIPNVVFSDSEILVLEFVESGSPEGSFWTKSGKYLAQMHRISQENFGFGSNNYIGSLEQKNTVHPTWVEFFVAERIEPMLNLAFKKALISREIITMFNQLFHKLDHLIPLEKPSLLHGDLWNGNFMCTNNNEPCIYDPAVYYGHREMDLAMTQLFGGFNNKMYSAYHEEFPLETGFDERIDLHNLYPLLVHLNLFGGSYLNKIVSTLKRFT